MFCSLGNPFLIFFSLHVTTEYRDQSWFVIMQIVRMQRQVDILVWVLENNDNNNSNSNTSNKRQENYNLQIKDINKKFNFADPVNKNNPET